MRRFTHFTSLLVARAGYDSLSCQVSDILTAATIRQNPRWFISNVTLMLLQNFYAVRYASIAD
jgi:hypothetical protein